MKQYKASLLIDYSTFVRVSDVGCSGVHGLCTETVLLHIALPSPSLSRSHQAGFPSCYIAFLTPVYLHLSSFLSSCIFLDSPTLKSHPAETDSILFANHVLRGA